MGQHFVDFEVRTDRTLTVPAIRIFLAGDAFLTLGHGGAFTGINPYIGGHVEGTAVSIVAVKTIDIRSVLDRFGEVNLVAILMPVPSKVPLPDHLGGVAGLPQHMGKGWPICWYQMGACATEDTSSFDRTPVVSASE